MTLSRAGPATMARVGEAPDIAGRILLIFATIAVIDLASARIRRRLIGGAR